jgi:hypothetical protein
MNNDMTNEQERELTRQLLCKMSKHVAMAGFVAPPARRATDVVNSGTVSLIDIRCGKVIVTNHHVWHGYCEEREKTDGLILAMFGEGLERPLNISSCELIDSDEGSDLAILRFAHPDFIESIGKSFYQPKRWPLDAPVSGDQVAFVGFPWNRRSATEDVFRHESVLLAPSVLAVNDRKMILAFNQQTLTKHEFSGRPVNELIWSGMSGSMVYRLDPDLNQ